MPMMDHDHIIGMSQSPTVGWKNQQGIRACLFKTGGLLGCRKA
jgi:hypothetical protein